MQGTIDRPMLLFLLAFWLTSLLPLPGCLPNGTNGVGRPARSSTLPALSTHDAAELAARLANQQCAHQFQGRRPFHAAQYSAELRDGLYHWGKLDVGGAAGFSAIVTFRQNGSDPHVEFYFSSDALGIR